MATLFLILLCVFGYTVEMTYGVERVCLDFGPIYGLFLHADPIHLAGNMAFLLVFGLLVEHNLGKPRFVALYFLAGAGGMVLHSLVSPETQLVGASGAIFGLMAVAATLRPRLVGFVIGFAGLNLWYAFTGAGGSVSFACHLGGLAVGFVFALVQRVREGEG